MNETYDRLNVTPTAAAVAHEGRRDTKERILDAAEALFAERGFHETSLRQITTTAEVNLAAVNYHFQSKDSLIEAVLLRKLEPINRRRLEMLDRLEAGLGDKTPTLEQVFTAFLEPVFEARSAGVALRSFPVLMARLYMEPGGLFDHIWSRLFAAVARRFRVALVRAMPELGETEIGWAMHFSIGAMAHYLIKSPLAYRLAYATSPEIDSQEQLPMLVAYMAGGFRGMLAAAEKRKERNG
jgi:AcrR family transcriptional regulator